MKNKPNLWNSVSVLVVAVLIVTAFIRGMAQIWLYAAVFAAWAVWVSVCDSLENGVITLYNRIKSKVNADYNSWEKAILFSRYNKELAFLLALLLINMLVPPVFLQTSLKIYI